ncbi:hypothetical protein E8L90_05430 [Brevibacillus antibioticus]|uniref:Uncharacterized protein n=1 Tax=Brevibacillus antibioticus TaxID=2570228 RepID=A0A4U2Y5E1_9BACL|nr:hypothetical protein [Brevibacillus antibioticus]TKI54932.1 hypothetical protein E8L90_05430 [Brevibacillus antibioticus]
MKLKCKVLSLSIFAVLSLTIGGGNQGVVLSKENSERISIQQLEEKATDDKVTILVFDEEEKISEEIHSDGLRIKYIWDEDQLISSEDSQGGEERYGQKDGKFVVERFYNDKLIEVKSTNLVESVTEGEGSKTELSEALVTNENYMVKGYRMNDFISDTELTNSKDLNEASIQKFLNRENSILSDPVKVFRKDKNGSVYDANISVSSAKLIYNAQKDHGISAKVLLALVQKESGLVRAKKGDIDYDDRKFIFALGNGATDGGDMYKLSGFDKQFDGAARTLKKLYNEGDSKSFPVMMTVNNGKTVKHENVTYRGEIWVRNAATYAMFRYTPWTIDTSFLPKKVGGGNYLYIQCYNMFW